MALWQSHLVISIVFPIIVYSGQSVFIISTFSAIQFAGYEVAGVPEL